MLPYRLKRSAVTVVSAQAARTGTPYSAMLEIADRCNEACVHCYQVQGQKGELPTKDWERVLDELAEMGVMLLTLSGGEPTLRKDFLHLVSYARRLRFAVKIYSNGLNITRAMAEELGRLAVQELQISLYSHEAAVHDGVTRVPGSFDQVVAATGYLRAAGVKVVLKTPVMSSNASGMAAYIDFVTSLGADFAVDPKLNPREDGDFAPRKLSIDHDAHLALMREPRLQMPPRQGPQLLGNRVCGACNGNVHVEANGELRPCTQWSIATGQVADGGLAHAWQNNPIAKVIRDLSWQSLPGCRVCDLRGHCKRCFANAQREVGDALMPYPSACQSARWSYEVRNGVAPQVLGAPGAAEPSESVPSEPPLGPYRQVGEHRFQVEAIALGPADHARRAEQPWLRSAPSLPGTSLSGQLVQLRRQPQPAPLTARPTPPSIEVEGRRRGSVFSSTESADLD